jgi:tetratricopeptide (TPR) repeat protein
MRIATLLLAILSPLVWGQQTSETTITLTGNVVDATTHHPVADAKVTLPGTQAVHEDYTDVKGVFTLDLSKLVRPGAVVRLRIEKTGYKVYEEKLSASAPLAHPIQLTPLAPAPRPALRKLSVRGYVLTGDGAALPGVKVLIQGGPTSKPTGPAGQFTIDDITPPPDVGYPVTFEVIGWIIDQPFYLRQRGTTYLPDPKAPPINLIVLKPADQAFLQGPSIQKILGAWVYDFSENSTKALLRPHPSSLRQIDYMRECYSIASFAPTGDSPSERANWEDYLAAQSSIIRIPLPQLLAAVEKWVTHADNPYQRGLAALYRNDYDSAAKEFHAATDTSDAPKEQLLASISYAEYKRGNLAESLAFLEKLVQLHPSDPTFQRNLQIVRAASSRNKSSEDRDRRRFEICSEAMGHLAKKQAEALRTLFSPRLAEAASEMGVTHLFHQIESEVGRFYLIKKQSPEYQSPEPAYSTVSKFERGDIEMILTFNDNDQIDTLKFWIPPRSEHHSGRSTEWEFPIEPTHSN